MKVVKSLDIVNEYIKKLEQENKQLKEKIDKALKELEWVLPVYTTPIGQVIHLEDKLASIERAIKILGDKENE